MLTIFLTALVSVPRPQEPAQPTVAEELAALIEKTNAMESFHAIYDATRPEEEGGAMTLELVYRAPDLGLARVHGSDMELEVWMIGTDFYLRQGETWKHASLEPPSFFALMDESFPPAERSLEPGVALRFSLSRDATKEGKFQINFINTMGAGRTFVLGWLPFMKAASDVVAEGSSLRWEDDGMRLVVSRATGMLEEAVITNADRDGTLRLREAQVDGEVEPSLLAPPSEALAAPIDPTIAGSFKQIPGELRKLAFLRVESCLAADRRTWNETARTDCRAVLESMHREFIEDRYTDWRDKTRERIERAVETARENLDADDSAENRTSAEEYLAETRATLEDTLSSAEAKYSQSLVAIESSRVAPRQELYDLEQVVVAELWAELLHDPLLTAYDEAMAEVLKH